MGAAEYGSHEREKTNARKPIMQANALTVRENANNAHNVHNNNVAVLAPLAPARNKPRLEARFVRHDSELRDAQLLRAQVFGEEYGVQFDDPEGLDRDHLDDFCEHLNVYDVANGLLIATTRLMSGEMARLAGSFYSAHEFNMTALEKLPGRVLELGRTCVHPDYRSGAAIMVLWSALTDYMMNEEFRYLIGCASISLKDGGQNFAAIMPQLRAQHFIAEEWRVVPQRELNIAPIDNVQAVLPPLLTAYLRMGCKIGGEACWDADFNCADVFVLLDVQSVEKRFAQRFLKAG
jgi:putative hemolysin